MNYYPDTDTSYGPWEIKEVIAKYLEWHQVALENEIVDYSKVIQDLNTISDSDLYYGTWKDNQIPSRTYVFQVSLEIGNSYPDFYLNIIGVTRNTEPDSTYLTDRDFVTSYLLPHESVLELNEMLNEGYLISTIKKYKNRGEDLDKLFK